MEARSREGVEFVMNCEQEVKVNTITSKTSQLISMTGGTQAYVIEALIGNFLLCDAYGIPPPPFKNVQHEMRKFM